MTSNAGKIINNYQLIDLLGHGSYAEVYLGQHIESKEHAAIKLLHAYITDELVKENFLKEAHLITELKHPNIIQIYDIGFNNTTPFLIMSYVSNGSLREKYPRGSLLPLEIIVYYTKQLANALQYAHDKNIIHCDVKPENILLNQEGNLILSDFGIAHIAQTTRVQTTHAPEGTPTYMAPEQFRGKPRPESDQYALGVIVYEWLCGEPPFMGKTFNALMDKHLYNEPPTLQSKDPSISFLIETVVLKALAKDPKKRFNHTQDFALALEKAFYSEQKISQSKNIMTKSMASFQRACLSFSRKLSSKRNVTRRTIIASLLVGGVALVGELTWQTRTLWLPMLSPISPASLESNYRTAYIHINRSGLLKNDPASINEVKTQVKKISFLQARRAGLVSIVLRTISKKDQDIKQVVDIGNKIYDILRTMGKEDPAFASTSFDESTAYTDDPSMKTDSAELDIYLFR